jgi:hypothetical protein
MKKQSFFTAMPLPLAGVLAALVLTMGACRQPADNDYSGQLDGYGRISVRCLTPDASRTAFPAAVFDKYVYTFTKAGETAGTEKSPDSNGFFTLEIGSYTVVVLAFTGNAGSYTLAASAVSPQFSVGPGDNEPVVVRLRAAAEGQGEFSYIITYPAGAWAEISLLRWPDMGVIDLAPSQVAERSGLAETLELEAGTYLLTVQVNKNGRYTGISEAVHIYPSLTTVYDKDFIDGDFPAPAQSVMPDRFEYYWIDQHGSLVTTGGGEVSIAPGETLAITAQGDGYSVRQWHLNGVDTGQSGNTYYFSDAAAGKHTAGLLVAKDDKLYNTNITITVEGAAETVTRLITIDMFDVSADGWNGTGALRITVNGIEIANNVKVHTTADDNTPAGQRGKNSYTFPAATGDVVQLYWVEGHLQDEISFIVYYAGTPPIPAFTAANNSNWDGDNALVCKLRGTMGSITGGTLLGTFTAGD